MDRTDPHRNPAIRLTGTEQSEHDALAELFLGDAPFAPTPMFPRAPDEASGPRPTPGAACFEGGAVRRARAEASTMPDGLVDRPVIELVILGHLPVRASLWVRQYACLSARKRCETVALVRASGGAAAVDVVTGNEPPRIEAAGSIAEGVRAACLAATRVVLRVDETVEPELLWRDGVDEVTILTGADEAAVVASYRLIKSLAGSLDDRLDPETAPALRVAVMGNPGPEIDAARHKIERACLAFLDRTIEVLDASGRIDATGTTAVCRSDAPDAAARALDALLGVGGVASAGPASLTPSTPSPGTLRLADPDGDAGAEPACVREVAARPIGAGARAPAVVQVPEPRRDGDQTAGRVAEPAVAAEIAVCVAGFRREPLAYLIEGLAPIEARCPAALGVELACDGEGRLHAVTTDEGGAGEGVSRLLAATAWARANLALLIRAEPGISIPSSDPREGAEAFMHLLARRPSAARAVLDTEVRVYALASVDLDAEEIMVATLLNDG